jgi:hypothetical protein
LIMTSKSFEIQGGHFNENFCLSQPSRQVCVRSETSVTPGASLNP